MEIVAPAIRTSSIHLQTLSFTKVNIGDKVSESACQTQYDRLVMQTELMFRVCSTCESVHAGLVFRAEACVAETF